MTKKTLIGIFALLSLFITVSSCSSWMKDDDFFDDIEDEVEYANAPEINVFVRYAATSFGSTVPQGNTTFKVGVPYSLSATTASEYGFYRWTAFTTNRFVPGTQYDGYPVTEFVFIDDVDYEANYADDELPDSVVHFSNPTSPNTEVTIKENRNDIYIIPLVVRRPYVQFTLPTSGNENVMRNMSIRIVFSKEMDPDSFKDTSEGDITKFSISKVTQSLSSGGDYDLYRTDISGKFKKPEFSPNGKMISFMLNDGDELDEFTDISVEIPRGVKDKYGFEMINNFQMQFKTGTGRDSLAPRIIDVSAGIGNDFASYKGYYFYTDTNTPKNSGNAFVSFKDGNAASSASKSSYSSSSYYNKAYRVSDKLNLRVYAADLSGSGSGQSATAVESDVSSIAVRATRLFDSVGNSVSDSSVDIPSANITGGGSYKPKENTSEISGKYEELITSVNQVNNLALSKDFGCLYTITTSIKDSSGKETLPDGLYRIDIAATDIIGNTGFKMSEAIAKEYGNGYASIFVIKDSTAPSASDNAAKITSDVASAAAQATYGWYNASTYGSIKIQPKSGQTIVDVGTNSFFYSKPEDIKWIVNTTDDENWSANITRTDPNWAKVTDGWSLTNMPEPTSNGSLPISYILMDDVGNISAPQSIDSIMYDGTVPVIGALSWVDSSGNAIANETKDLTITDKYLKLPFTEEDSGVKEIEVHVLKNGAVDETASPMDSVKIDCVDSTTTEMQLTSSGTNTKVLNKTANPLDNGIISNGTNYFRITKLKLAETGAGTPDGQYDIKVKIRDAALNISEEAVTSFILDTTAPQITNLSVAEAVGNYVKNQNVTLNFTATETGTGVKTIEVGQNAALTSTSKLIISGTEITNAVIDYINNTITLADPQILNEIAMQITNVSLNDSTNTIRVTAKDNVENSGYCDKIGLVKDGTAPVISSVILTDADSNSVNEELYTNSHTVNMKITFTDGDASGVKSISITDATFAVDAAVTSELLTGGNTATFDGNTVTFDNAINYSDSAVFNFTGVIISSAGNGTKTVSVKAKDLVGNETGTASKSNSICVDETAPTLATNSNLTWIVPSGSSSVAGIFSGTEMIQTLNVPVKDDTSGIAKIQIDITKDGSEPYAAPFSASGFKLEYAGTSGSATAMTSTDYSVSGRVITLNSSYKMNGNFRFTNLKFYETEAEGSYIVSVKLFDAAGNQIVTPVTLGASNDSTAPEITKLYVPGIVSVGNDYWISKEYAYDSKANPVEIELTVKENNSGVSKILFDTTGNLSFNNVTVKLNDVPVSCTSNSATKTITIAPENAINKNGTNESFTIRIEGVCLFTDNLSNSRTIKMKVYDVAGNYNSISYGTVESDGDGIPLTINTSINYKNSSPSIQSVTLTDRNSTDHKAQDGFTNEQYVNLKIELNVSGTKNVPVYKITLDGATFDNTGENPIRVKNGSSDINVDSDKLIISNDKKSLAIKYGTGYAEMANGSITAGSYKNTITINNVKLDSATEGAHTVNVTVTNACQFTDGKSSSITLDTTKPTWNTTNPLYSYYNSSYVSKIYPTPQASSKAYGPVIGSDQYFYTAFKDGSDTKESCYVAGDCTESNLLGFTTSGTTLSAGNSAIKLTSGSTEYSIVAIDKAGNVSEPKVCYVKAENSKESIDVSELYNRITLVKPDASADIYRMDRHEDTTIKNADIKYQNSGTSFNIYAYKTVIKSTSDNYVIKVKMGSGLTDVDKKIFGGSVTPTSNSFTNYNPTTTHSPVTAYTVTHYYSHWADKNDSQRTFEPKFPDGTYNFILQSYFNSAPSYGWMNDSNASNNERITSNCTWHEMSKRNVTNTDDKISSYVDENGDINIKIPTTGKIPPLTLLLKNGTGQLNYVYLTELSSGTTQVADAWNDVTTWEVDDKLGGAKVGADGSTGKRTIVMNPISSEASSEASSGSESWGTVKYNWGSQAGTTAWESSKDGNSTTGLAIKNKVNKTTYYTNDVKAGLFIDNNSEHKLPGAPESITFTVTGKRSDPATAEQVAAGEYTARAKLYCTKSSTAPTYSTIVSALETNGQVTPWCYVRTKADQGTVFFMDYPHPNYSALNWDSKEPYYIYYLVEDRVGNYEIQTVVNSSSDTDMVKWLYDAEGPKVTLRGKTTSPANVTTNVSDLVPNNNGYKASYNASKYYTWWTTTSKGEYNSSQGKGTTRTVGGAPDRKYAPFFDIDVTDDSGIRAFAYSDTYIENPKVSTFSFYTAEQGEGKWFGGQGSPTKDTIIGESWTDSTYNSAGKYKVLKADGSVDASYNNVYTGAAVCSVLPLYEETLTGKELYLYVMDWVGNISCTKMGGYSWNKDISDPAMGTKRDDFSDQYYIDSNGIIELAGKKVAGLSTTKIYLPSDFYIDSSTSIYGWSFIKNDVSSVKVDETGSYIELNLGRYSEENPILEDVYIYDIVGNCLNNQYFVYIDSTPPSYDLHVRSEKTDNNLYIKGQGYNADAASGYPKNHKLKTGSGTKLYETLYDTEEDIKANSYYVYTVGDKVVFLPNSNEISTNSKIDIFKWSGTQWNKVSSYTSTSSTGGTFLLETNWCTCPEIQVSGTNAGYFCFALSDRAGNTNYAYVYAKQDITPPAVETICSKVNTINGINYFSAVEPIKYKVIQNDSGIYQINTTKYSDYTTVVGPLECSISTGKEVEYAITVINNNQKSDSVKLEHANSTKWTYDNTPPVLAATPVSLETTPTYYQKCEISEKGEADDGEKYFKLKVSTGITKVKVKFSVSDSESDGVMGYLIKDAKVADSDFKDFYTLSEVIKLDSDIYYTFTKDDNYSAWNSKINKKYFYAVSKSGLVNKTPITIEFATMETPVINNITFTGVNKVSNCNYFNMNSTIKLTVKNQSNNSAATGTTAITSMEIQVGSGTGSTTITLDSDSFTEDSNGVYTITGFDFSVYNITNNGLKIRVSNGAEWSEYKEMNYNNCSTWTFDKTPPVFDSPAFTVSDTDSTRNDAVIEKNGIYYFNHSSINVSLNSSSSDVAKYQYSTDGNTWTDMNNSSMNATISEGEIKTYQFRLVDKAGNISTTVSVKGKCDKTVPTVTGTDTIIPSMYKDNTLISSENMIGNYVIKNNVYVYNPSKINKLVLPLENVSVTDVEGGVGLDTNYYAYSTTESGAKSALTLSGTNAVFDLSENAANQECTYYIWAVDMLGNAKVVGNWKVKAYSGTPEIPASRSPAYTGLKDLPKYNNNPILGFDSGNGYAMNPDAAEKKISGTAYLYDNSGKPKTSPEAYSDYITRVLQSDSTTMTIPVKKDKLPTSKVSYVLTYDSIVEPTTGWSEFVDVSSGKINNVLIDNSQINTRQSFIFIWFKDELDNISVFNITYPSSTGQNWWTTTEHENDNPSTFEGFSRSVSHVSFGARIVKNTFNTVKSIFTPKTNQVDLAAQKRMNSNTVTEKVVMPEKEQLSSIINTVNTEESNAAKDEKSEKTEKSELRTKVLSSEVVEKSTVEVEKDIKVMESTPISEQSERTLVISDRIDNSGTGTSYIVENTPEPKDYTNVIYIILACVMVCVITLVVFVNKKIIDKTKN